MKLFSDYLINNKRNVLLYIFISLAGNAALLSAANILKKIYNSRFDNQEVIQANILPFLFAYILVFIFNLVGTAYLTIIQGKGERNLALKAVKNVAAANYTFFHNSDSSALSTEITMSAYNVAVYFTSFIKLFYTVITFFIYFYIIVKINFVAALVSLVFVPVMLLLTMKANRKASVDQEEVLKSFRTVSAEAAQIFKKIKNVKTKNGYSFFLHKIDEKQKILSEKAIQSGIINSYISSISSFVMSISPVIIIYILISYTESLHLLGASDILLIFSFLPLFISSALDLYSLVSDFFMKKANFTSLNRFNQLEVERTGEIIINSFQMLSAANLTISLENGRELRVPDMKIEKGDKVLFIGESGVGKTSFFHLLTGLNKEYSGSVKVNGIELREINNESLRNVFGISMQTANVLSMSLKDNIRLSNHELAIGEVINLFGLNELEIKKGDDILTNNNLSGGEKARINMAMTLAKNPDVILFDETLSSLDESMEAEILSRFKEDHNEKTLIVISHRIPSSQYFDQEISFI